ncbi:MAG TPA: hypothetical protein VN845_10080 [Solirubrobacteraceae bacterium]|nr:hypothetical protein [Solirubrobacteraceae bacterium]
MPAANHLLMLGFSDPDLTAIGGVGAFLAAIVLAGVAAYQARQSRNQAVAMHEQVEAGLAQERTLREMTSAQLRPVVHAHPSSRWVTGPDERLGIGPREMALAYSLSNNGSGVALRVQHGVNIGGMVEAPGYGKRIDALRAGEHVPTSGLTRAPRPAELLMVSVHQEEVPANYAILPLTYWVRYESVLGEQLQTSVQLSARQLRDLIPQEGEEAERDAGP